MKKLTQIEVDEILRLHKLWLNGEPGGEKADLSNCDFHKSDLTFCDFSKSILINCDFSECILNHCDFNNANFERAILKQASLNNSDFGGANFEGANLRQASLNNSDFGGANFEGANLKYASLGNCNFGAANLTGANLDFSTGIPLQCGGLNIKLDKHLMCQLIYHLCSMECDDEEVIKAQNCLLDLANQSHLVDKHGLGKIYF